MLLIRTTITKPLWRPLLGGDMTKTSEIGLYTKTTGRPMYSDCTAKVVGQLIYTLIIRIIQGIGFNDHKGLNISF